MNDFLAELAGSNSSLMITLTLLVAAMMLLKSLVSILRLLADEDVEKGAGRLKMWTEKLGLYASERIRPSVVKLSTTRMSRVFDAFFCVLFSFLCIYCFVATFSFFLLLGVNPPGFFKWAAGIFLALCSFYASLYYQARAVEIYRAFSKLYSST